MTSPRYKLALLGAFQNNNFTGDIVRMGAEWTYREMFALRGSYFGQFSSTTDPTTGAENVSFESGERIYSGYSLGFGTSIRTGDTARLGIDVAWRPVKDFFNDTFDFGLKMTF
jgi:hypothetical protein